MIISGIVAKAASQLILSGMDDEPIIDEKPPTSAQVGDYIPLVVGRQLVGGTIARVENRTKQTENAAGGKGVSGSAGKQTVFYEDGIHLLCVGPVQKLYNIKINGKYAQFNNGNAITPSGFPSGTTLTVTSKEDDKDVNDSMTIFWGEEDQPIKGKVSDMLGAPTRLPYFCYVLWEQKRLGGFPNWPSIEYEVEVAPFSQIVDTSTWSTGGYDNQGLGPSGERLQAATDCILYGSSDTYPQAQITIPGDRSDIFTSDLWVELFDQYTNTANGIQAIDTVSTSTDTVYTRNPDIFYWPDNQGFRHVLTNPDWTSDSFAGSVSVAFEGKFNTSHQDWLDYIPNKYDGSPHGSNDGSFYKVTFDYEAGFNSYVERYIYTDTLNNNTNIRYYGKGVHRFRFLVHGLDPANGKSGFELPEDYVFKIGFIVDGVDQRTVTIATKDSVPYIHSEDELCRAGLSYRGKGWWLVECKYLTFAERDPYPDDIGGIKRIKVVYGTYPMDSVSETSDDFSIVLFPWNEGFNSGDIWSLVKHVGVPSTNGSTNVVLKDPVYGLKADVGEVESYISDSESGVKGANPAHVLAQVLFEQYPHGLGLDSSLWDLDSFQSIGELSASEAFKIHIQANRGQEASEIVSKILSEGHMYIAWNANDGKYYLGAFRASELENVKVVEPEVLSGNYPQYTFLQNPDIPNAISFSYKSRKHNYRRRTRLMSNDGASITAGNRVQKTIKLDTVTDVFSAEIIAKRKKRELLSQVNEYKFSMKNEARSLLPGDSFILRDFPEAGYEEYMKVISVEIDPDSSKIKVTGTTDVFTNYELVETSTVSGPDVPPPFGEDSDTASSKTGHDLVSEIWELPPYLSDNKITNALLRVAYSQASEIATVLASADNLSYEQVGQNRACVGGVLLQEIDARTPMVFDSTFAEFKQLGSRSPLSVPVLDTEQWSKNRVVGYMGGELFSIKQVIPMADDHFKVEGVLRARLGTQRTGHPVGSIMYIFPLSELVRFSDLNMSSGRSLHMKALPPGTDLDSAIRREKKLEGTGIRPLRVEGLRNKRMDNEFFSNTLIKLFWMFHDPEAYRGRFGGGFQRAGEKREESTNPKGFFRIKIFKEDETVPMREEEITKPSYDYDASTRIADSGGSEPTHFVFQVEHVYNGYSSTSNSITITRAD